MWVLLLVGDICNVPLLFKKKIVFKPQRKETKYKKHLQNLVTGKKNSVRAGVSCCCRLLLCFFVPSHNFTASQPCETSALRPQQPLWSQEGSVNASSELWMHRGREPQLRTRCELTQLSRFHRRSCHLHAKHINRRLLRLGVTWPCQGTGSDDALGI